MNRLQIIRIVPIFFLLLATSCLEDTLESTQPAERHYVDLIHALHFNDQPAARDAAQQFTSKISGVHPGHYPLRSEEETENMRFRLDKAEETYREVSNSIDQGNLELAMQQLTTATAQLDAARIPGLQDLYIANVRDFLFSWLEVSRLWSENGLPAEDWKTTRHRIKTSYTFWRQCRGARPSASVYFFSDEDSQKFLNAHARVDRLMDQLKESLPEENVNLTKSFVEVTDSAVWELMARFGSFGNERLKEPPAEKDPTR